MMIGGRPQVFVRIPSAGDQHAGNIVTEGRVQHGDACVVRQALEIAHLAFAEYDDAPGTEILVEPGKSQAGFLNVRTNDAALESARSAQQFER